MGELNKKGRARKAGRWMGIVSCLQVIGGTVWLLDAPAQQGGSEAEQPNAPSVAGGAQPARTASASATANAVAGQAAAARPGSVASGPVSADARELADIEAQWCSHGAQAHQQALAALQAGHPRANFQAGRDGKDPALRAAEEQYFEARRALPTEKAQRAVEARLVTGWVDALLRQGDLQARATAHFLAASSAHLPNEREAHARQLVELARQSSDPYLARLWQKVGERCYGNAYCQGPPAGHWARIEPANALAWLPEWNDKRPLTAAEWAGLAQARYARAPGHKLQSLLLDQVAALPEGMALDVALRQIEYLARGWNLDQPSTALYRHCTQSGSVHRAACLHAANLYWDHSHPALEDRGVLMSLVHQLGAEAESPWKERLAALQGMTAQQFTMHLLDANHGPDPERQPGCSALVSKRQRLRDQAEGGTWLAAQRRLAPG